MSARQQRLVDERLPELAVSIGAPRSLNPMTLFDPVTRNVWLEIGFGGGEHLSGQAARNPDVGFVGCEPFIEGMAKCLGQIEDSGLHNVRLVMDDARLLIGALQPACVDRVFLLFPDPWPKKRQQKRRLIQPDFLDELAVILKTGGRVRFATDVVSYANEALARFVHHGAFQWLAQHPDDWRHAPTDHIPTRYQEKRLGDCAPVWLEFERLPSKKSGDG